MFPYVELTSLIARSPREVACLMLRNPERLRADGRELLDQLFVASAELTQAYAFAQGFRELMRERDLVGFCSWLARATKCRV